MLKNIAGVAITRLTLVKLNNSILTLAPFEEQHQIVTEIERCFSIADEVEQTVEQSLQQAERLRQSILKQAFIGQLVPQHPDDEPAAALLERIQAEKVRREKGQKTVRKTRKRP